MPAHEGLGHCTALIQRAQGHRAACARATVLTSCDRKLGRTRWQTTLRSTARLELAVFSVPTILADRRIIVADHQRSTYLGNAIRFVVAKYRIKIDVTLKKTARTEKRDVEWSCTRLPNTPLPKPGTRSVANETIAEQLGVLMALDDARKTGETLTPEDVEVDLEFLVFYYKNGREDGPPHRMANGPRRALPSMFEDPREKK